MIEKVTFFEVLFSFVLWLVIYFISNSAYKKDSLPNPSLYLKVSALAIALCVFAYYIGDFPHYKSLYFENLNSNDAIHVEPIYFWLIKNLPESYFLWRFFVWGAAVVLWCVTCKRLEIKPQYACLAFTVILLFYFAAPRQSLAYLLLCYGASYIFRPGRSKLFSWLYALLLIYLSTFFHQSMIAFVVLFVIACIIPFNKKVIIISLAIFPVMYTSMMMMSSAIFEFLFSSDSISRGTLYLEGENFIDRTLFGWIHIIIQRIPIALSIFYMLYKIYFKREDVDKSIIPYLKYSYLLMYIGFLFMEQPTSSFLSPRFLDATYYPLALVMPYYMWKEKGSKTINRCLLLFLLSNIYYFLYTLYTISR